jgi:hypothetical protein
MDVLIWNNSSKYLLFCNEIKPKLRNWIAAIKVNPPTKNE